MVDAEAFHAFEEEGLDIEAIQVDYVCKHSKELRAYLEDEGSWHW
jgi:hypothetical protein